MSDKTILDKELKQGAIRAETIAKQVLARIRSKLDIN